MPVLTAQRHIEGSARNDIINGWDIQMNIARIGHVKANPEMADDLREFLISIMPVIKGSQGCESVQHYQSQDDPTQFTMIEIWDSIESHQASVKNIPPEKLQEIRPLLAGSPSGGYYEWVAST
jgi:quinol monooxygenase YgiN